MGNMRFKAGDRVKIKSLDWYNRHTNGTEEDCGLYAFTSEMKKFCGQERTITRVDWDCYYLSDIDDFAFIDEMIEGLVEEENVDCEKCGLTRNSTRCLFMDNCPHNKQKNIIEIPKDWVLKDENGNVINATKIVLEKKKNEYPKTYAECCEILDVPTVLGFTDMTDEEVDLYGAFISLKRCRDAYWKIAGEEMGLGKPWEPDWTNADDKFIIQTYNNKVGYWSVVSTQRILAFPTPEMRDAFKENFDPDIEFCREFL